MVILKANTRNKYDEIEFLKESLNNTKILLDREKILNSALKNKKVKKFKICFD